MHVEPSDDRFVRTAVQSPGPTSAGNDEIEQSGVVRSRRRTDWRLGGRAVRRWNTRVLIGAFLGGGAGLLTSIVLGQSAWNWGTIISPLALWTGLVCGVVFAFSRARPAGLLNFRPQDLLWGLGLGLGLRAVQGFAAQVNTRPFPTSGWGGEITSINFWLTEIAPAGLIGPVIEELFFRAVLLVTVFQLLRRGLGSISAGLTAALVSAGSFVLLHASFATLSLPDALQLLLVGLVCAGVVLVTGRIWSAVLAHMVYNASFLVLIVVGTVGR